MKSKKSTTQAAKPRTPRGSVEDVSNWLTQVGVFCTAPDATIVKMDVENIAFILHAAIATCAARGFSDAQIGEHLSAFIRPSEQAHELVRITMKTTKN